MRAQVLDAISKGTGDNIAEVAGSLQPPGDATVPAEAEDITSRFLGPRMKSGPVLSNSSICLYKGLLAKLNNCSKKLEDGAQVAVLAGQDKVVRDVILAPSIAAVATSEACLERWKKLQFKVLGAVWLSSQHKYKNHLPDLRSLQPAGDSQLLILYRAPADPSCFEVQGPLGACGSDAETEVHLVDVKSVAENRKKDLVSF